MQIAASVSVRCWNWKRSDDVSRRRHQQLRQHVGAKAQAVEVELHPLQFG
jgi:hypothetical protein